MRSLRQSRIYVLAGVNGAGKSSVGGAALRESGSDYYNPDEATRSLIAAKPRLTQSEANSVAWHKGVALLERAIDERLDCAFETTLGGNTITRLLSRAALQGIEIYVWYVGLSSPPLHIERVRARVARGGHDVPAEFIRRRYEHSRLNLIELMPHITELRVSDNSADADPSAGKIPLPVLVLEVEHGKILNRRDLSWTPTWAKPIVAAALKLYAV
jgi:predicted ABC-type ATPase